MSRGFRAFAFLSARRTGKCAHIATQMALFASLSAHGRRFGAHLRTQTPVAFVYTRLRRPPRLSLSAGLPVPAVRSTVSGKKRRSAAELEQPHGLLAFDWADQARPVALRRSDLMEMQLRGQLGTGLAHRREQTGAVD